jgi:putative membrane protein
MSDMPAGHERSVSAGIPHWPWLLMLVALVVVYQAATLAPRHKSAWPWQRSLCWNAGIIVAGAALVGPFSMQSHDDFRRHMLGHLLLGMLAPLLIVLAAPVTLVLRTIHPRLARRLVRVLGSAPIRGFAHPLTGAVLSIGGLWLLYFTPLYGAMHGERWLSIALEVHIAVSGYLFTAAIIGIDPVRHRPSWLVRTMVLCGALAAHSIVAKLLYIHFPDGVSESQGRAASKLMYYGGDLIGALLIAIYCWQWYRSGRPLPPRQSKTHISIAS